MQLLVKAKWLFVIDWECPQELNMRVMGEVMIYEHYRKGMYLTPNKSALTYNSTKILEGDR